jgi:hypothetical protein
MTHRLVESLPAVLPGSHFGCYLILFYYLPQDSNYLCDMQILLETQR